jgi:hypothetical protein
MSVSKLKVAVAAVLALALGASSAAARPFAVKVTGPADAPRMVFDKQMKVVSVCMPVTNPQGGQLALRAARHRRAGERLDPGDRARARDRLLD